MRRLESQRDDLATKQGQQWLTWIVGIGFTVMLAGLTALLTLIVYLHSDTKAEMREIKTELKEIKELLQKR